MLNALDIPDTIFLKLEVDIERFLEQRVVSIAQRLLHKIW